MRELRETCLEKKPGNKGFWDKVRGVGRPLSFISSAEATKAGGKSDISESEAQEVCLSSNCACAHLILRDSSSKSDFQCRGSAVLCSVSRPTIESLDYIYISFNIGCSLVVGADTGIEFRAGDLEVVLEPIPINLGEPEESRQRTGTSYTIYCR